CPLAGASMSLARGAGLPKPTTPYARGWPMIARPVARLTFSLAVLMFLISALLGSANPARATGEYIQEIRFFSRSGLDPDRDARYFRDSLGILRPTFDDVRLYAAYRRLIGRTFTDAQAQQLLARCCDARGSDDDTATTWSDVRKRVFHTPRPDANAAP